MFSGGIGLISWKITKAKQEYPSKVLETCFVTKLQSYKEPKNFLRIERKCVMKDILQFYTLQVINIFVRQVHVDEYQRDRK